MALPDSSPKQQQQQQQQKQQGQSSNSAGDQDDKDFDPSAEALVDDIDDERTLEEEEALGAASGTAVQQELDDLKRESEMSIEELLAHYQRMRQEAQDGTNSDEEGEDELEDEDDSRASSEGEDESQAQGTTNVPTCADRTVSPDNDAPADSTSQRPLSQDVAPQSTQVADDTRQPAVIESQSSTPAEANLITTTTTLTTPSAVSTSSVQENDALSGSNQQQPQPQTCGNLEPNQAIAAVSSASDNEHVTQDRHKHAMTDFNMEEEDAGGMFRTLLGYDIDDSDDLDEDYSYSDDDSGDDERDWRRVIHVGAEYQADVPDGLIEYDDLPPYQDNDRLVWKCNPDLSDEDILDFLKKGSAIPKQNEISVSPASVPKISYDAMRSFRERMQDITSIAGPQTVEQNHEDVNIEQPLGNQQDKYIAQSRKRARYDYEIEQENAMDGISVGCADGQKPVTSSKEDGSDSASQDVRPEPSIEEYFQDEEQLLYLLLQCNYNFDEALRRRKLDPNKYYLHEPMTLWSQDECLEFEQGLKTFGKNFRAIRENKVPTRTRAEVVAFYYLWKKSERHDVYTNQYKLDRKRCLSHPGITDYMDKFIEDTESALNDSTSLAPTPSPTESTVGVSSNAEVATENNPSIPICHSADEKHSTIQCYLMPITKLP